MMATDAEEQAECGRTEIRSASCQLWPGAETANISRDSRTKSGGLFLSISAPKLAGVRGGQPRPERGARSVRA
jgi:hypothetical protein